MCLILYQLKDNLTRGRRGLMDRALSRRPGGLGSNPTFSQFFFGGPANLVREVKEDRDDVMERRPKWNWEFECQFESSLL